MPFKCEKCSKVLTTSFGLKKHQKAGCSTKKSNLKCPDCELKFTAITAITHHLRDDHGFQQDTTELLDIKDDKGSIHLIILNIGYN